MTDIILVPTNLRYAVRKMLYHIPFKNQPIVITMQEGETHDYDVIRGYVWRNCIIVNDYKNDELINNYIKPALRGSIYHVKV